MRKTSCGREDVVDQVVELAGGLQVVAERLLDHDPPPAAGLLVVRHPGPLQLLEHGRERGRRDGQVERRVALDPVLVAHLVGARAELVEGVVVVERARHEADVAGQPGPDVLPPRRPGVRLGRLPGHVLEVAVAPVPPGEADQHEVGRQQPAAVQVVHRREQLLAGQVAGHAEHDQRARLGHPGEPTVARVPQRVAPRRLQPWIGHGTAPRAVRSVTVRCLPGPPRPGRRRPASPPRPA